MEEIEEESKAVARRHLDTPRGKPILCGRSDDAVRICIYTYIYIIYM